MIRNLMKLGVLATVTGFSLNFASQTINEMVIVVHKREKTIADAIIKQKVQEMLKEAEKEIEKVQEETKIEIKQEEVAIKPPLPQKPKKDKPKEEKVEEEKVEQIEVAEVQDEMIIEESEQTEAMVDGAATDANLDMTTYYALTKEDITYIGEYLVDHYFLFGYEYYQAETDPVRYARKKLASDMEDHVIGSIGDSFTLLRDMKSLNSATLTPLAENAHLLAAQFKETYKDVASQGEEFARIYESVNSFMDTYLATLNKAEETFKMLEETTNKALVLPMLLKSMNQDLLPSVKDVLNEGFALKEQTNKIYIEGLEADFLITPEEVMDIIENPYSILPNKVPPTPPNEPNTVVLEEEIQPPVTTTSKPAESDVLKESEVGHATHEEATNLQSEETLESEGN